MLRVVADDHQRQHGQTDITDAALGIAPLGSDWLLDYAALHQQDAASGANLLRLLGLSK